MSNFTIRYMEHLKETEKARDSYMRFLRLCKTLLTDTGKQFELKDITPENEFFDDMVQTLKMDKYNLGTITPQQTDTIVLDMLFNAWNDINVAPNVDIEVKFKVYGTGSNRNSKRKGSS